MLSRFLWRSAPKTAKRIATEPTSSSTFLKNGGVHNIPKISGHQLVAARNFFFFEEKEDNRIRDIQVNPDGIGSKIKPGNLVDKYYEKTKNTRAIPTELAHGYFWMIKDLASTGGKPILSNPHLIPAKNAQTFPSLSGLQTLHNESVELPEFFLRKNRSKDENAQCTLVAVSCRDHGYQMLKSWTEPFREAFQGEMRVDQVHIHLNEGWLNSNVLKPLILRTVKSNTPLEEFDNTLLCFRTDLEEFRDALRIHNVLSGYVFLLDGVGRVRFAGSGEATDEEIERVTQFAMDLAPLMKTGSKPKKKRRQ